MPERKYRFHREGGRLRKLSRRVGKMTSALLLIKIAFSGREQIRL